MRVTRNPTLTEAATYYRFLAVVDNRETFQKLAKQPALELILSKIDHGPVRFSDLLRELIDDPRLDVNADDGRRYLTKLVDIGFLSLNTGLSGQDPDWDRGLVELIGAIEDKSVQTIVHLVENLRRLLDRYADSGPSERYKIAEEGRRVLTQAFASLDIEGGIHRNLLFYEDATARMEAAAPVDGRTQEVYDNLAEYIGYTARLAWPRSEQATMRYFFDSYYGECPGIPLLRFYEDYSRQMANEGTKENNGDNLAAVVEGRKTIDNSGRQKKRHNPFRLDFIAKMDGARMRLGQILRQKWMQQPGAEQINLTKEDVERAIQEVPAAWHGHRSFSVFGQMVASDADDPVFVTRRGRYSLGYGKYFSRFLYLFDDRVTERIRETNSRNTGDLLAEIGGDASFNANLHPALSSHEIVYPGCDQSKVADAISVVELDVVQCAEDSQRLRLRDRRNGRGIIPLDLGFLSLQQRSPLYQMLARFGPAAAFEIAIPGLRSMVDVVASAKRVQSRRRSENGDVVFRPRMTYAGNVVLARRAWLVEGGSFPVIGLNQDDVGHFAEVEEWRQMHGLPRQVFVRIIPKKATISRQHSKDFRKPQFVSFDSTLLVSLFGRLPEGLTEYEVVIEEALPGISELPVRDDGECVAYEQIIQFTDLP